MPTRDGNGLIQRPAAMASLPLTSTYNIYLAFGQSNSNGTSSLRLHTTVDFTDGGIRLFGRDGRQLRAGGSSWCDQAFPGSVYDFSVLAATEAQEPLRTYTQEVFYMKAMQILNARQVAATSQRHDGVVMTLGHTLYPISQLIKGNNSYTNVIGAATRINAIAVAAGKTPVIRGILWVQGESDFAASGSGYAATLATLRNDLNTDLKAVTGQSQNIPLFAVQPSNFSSGSSPNSGILYPVLDILAAHVANPGNIILCGPTYAAENVTASNLHYLGVQSARFGAGVGNALARVVVDGQTWEPIRPQSVNRSGNIVDIQFFVPNGSLVLDTTYTSNTPDGFFGFDFRQTGGTTTLQSVTLLNSNTLRFTLSGAPDGTSPFIRAGRNSAGTQVFSGPRTGARTCLRDSASTDPRWCNWCVHFDQAIT